MLNYNKNYIYTYIHTHTHINAIICLHSYMISNIPTEINLYTTVWFQVFLLNTNNLYTIIWFQVTIPIQ